MRKKYLSALLFGAMITASTGTFTSCKDYDADIKNLQEQVDAVKASVADLETKIQAGNWVTSVKDVEGGFEITFNDGNKYTIVNGEKGDKGDTGATGATGAQGIAGVNGTMWTIGEDGYWYKDDVKTDYKAIGEKGDKGDKGDQGDPGKNGYSPYIDSDTNTWWSYDDEEGKYVDTEILATNGSIYVTEAANRPAYILHVWNNDTEEYSEVILPTSSSISDLKLMNIDGNTISEGIADLEYNYGTVTDDEITFNNHKYLQGQTLYSHKTRSVVYAQINPSNIDFTATENPYRFDLVNSKGESALELKSLEQYKTEGALTRAEATWNKGIYKLTVKENINATAEAYALRTFDAYGNEIISAYDLTVSSNKVTDQELQAGEEDLAVGEAHDLYAIALEKTANTGDAVYNTLDDVADYYFTLPDYAQGVTIETVDGKQVIKSVKPQTEKVTVHYLTLNGTEKTVKLTLNFHKMVDLGTINVELNNALGRTDVDIVKYLDVDALVKDIISDNGITGSSTGGKYDLYVDNNGLTYDDPLSGTGISASLIKMKVDEADNNLVNGKYYFMATLQSNAIDDVNYTVKFNLKKDEISYAMCSLNINVTMNDDLFSYYKKSLWFEEGSWNAVAYGTPNGSNVEFDMFELFAEDVNGSPVEISADEQAKFKFTDNAETDSWIATPILDNHNLTISNIYMYKQHTLKAGYYPWGNKNLTPIEQEFTLVFKSPYHEAKQNALNEVVLNSLSATHEFEKADFAWIDPRTKNVFNWNETYGQSNNEVTSMKLTLSPDLALYVELSGTSSSDDLKSNNLILKFKSGVTMPVSTVTGTITLTVTDAWGVKTTQDVNVILRP